MIQAVIFDVDGVLLDTVPYHFHAWKQLFNEQKVTFRYTDYITKVNGLPRLTGITNMLPHLPDTDMHRLAEKKQSYFLQMVRSKPPKPLIGVVSLLQALKKMNISMAAASSSRNAPMLLTNAGIAPYFQTVVSGHDFTKPKPHPEIFLLAAQRIAIPPSSCLVVEDAVSGIRAARNAGMKSAGILSSQDQHIRKYADISIFSFKEKKAFLTYVTGN